MKDKEKIAQLEDTIVKQTIEYASATEMSVSCNVYTYNVPYSTSSYYSYLRYICKPTYLYIVWCVVLPLSILD